MMQMHGWRAPVYAAAAGAFAAFGQAPYDQPLLLLAGLAAGVFLFRLCENPRRAALVGWAFGLGYFAHALQWIVSPFLVDVARHGWMAPFAVALLAAGLALFWGGAFGAARLLHASCVWPLILCFPAAELTRAYIFTGFPWAMPAQALVSNLGGQALGITGPYVLNAALVALACGLSLRVTGPALRTGQFALVIIAVMALALPTMAPEATLTEHRVRLIQPNAAQRDKWDPDKIPTFFERQLTFSAADPKPGTKSPDLVLWSETAIPWRLDHAGTTLPQIAAAAGDATVALGVQRLQDDRHFNAMAVLGPDGQPTQIYDKHHLVPFGEYIPFADILNRFGIFGLAQRVPTGYASGPGAKLVDFGPLGRALPLICYEAVFPHDAAAAPERPDFLIQLTNDAWFGKGAGPRQHLAQARMRAIEQGLPLARSANTGISAMIDPYGQIIAALPLNEAGFVDAPLPAPLPPTLYSRIGDLPFALLLILSAVVALLNARRGQRGFSD